MERDRLIQMAEDQIIEEDFDAEDQQQQHHRHQHHHHHHHNRRDLDNNDGDGDIDDDSELDEMQVMRLNNPQVAMLLDAPHEPPFDFHQILGPVPMAPRPRKKRSFLTISKPFQVQPQMCTLIANGWQASQHAQPEERCEYFANYLNEHMNSKNYPNGMGLPDRWGEF